MRSRIRGCIVGEEHHNSKLTDEIVKAIYDRCAKGESYKQIAAEIGVHPTTIGGIAKGYTWQHLGLKPLNMKRHVKSRIMLVEKHAKKV